MLLIFVLCAVIVTTGGCIISIKGDACQSGKAMHHPEPDSTIAEIDAVNMLGSEQARLNVLRAIASRPGLSPQARIHLIDAVQLLGSESSREEVLMTLAENPPMRPEPMPAPEPCDDEEDD